MLLLWQRPVSWSALRPGERPGLSRRTTYSDQTCIKQSRSVDLVRFRRDSNQIDAPVTDGVHTRQLCFLYSWTNASVRHKRLTMRFCFSVYEFLSASMTQFTGGLCHICLVEHSMYGAGFSNRQLSVWRVVCLKCQCWVRCYSICTRWSDVIDRGQLFFTTSYTDDTQVYCSCWPVEVEAFSAKFSEFIGVISNWMWSNRLQFNSDKTDVLWCTTDRRQHQLATTHCRSTASRSLQLHPSGTWASSSIRSSDADARSTNSIRMLRCAPSTASDPQLSANGHVSTIGDRSGAIQTWLRKERADRSSDTPGKSPPVGAERSHTVICRLRGFDHVTNALVSLHWLFVPEGVV